jgi:hypothetical protein
MKWMGLKKLNRTICLPFSSERHYENCMDDSKEFIDFINQTYKEHPELFPEAMEQGFKLNGFTISRKQKGFRMRRIRLKNETRDAYQVRPSFMMPYMAAKTDEVEKALYLRRWGVPFDALAYVFGRDAMYWHRICVSLGHNSVVGTTVKDPACLPEHVVADEKHTRHKSDKVYVTTTVAQGCILGAGLAQDAGTKELTKGYQDFKEEAQNLDPAYQPKTVNTDGWEPTRKAWKSLFPSIIPILCYLHSFLKIRDRCKRSKGLFHTVKEKVWHVYHADTLAQFSQRIRRLREWAQTKVSLESVKDKILDLCSKAPQFKIAFSIPEAYRTSNALDRLMNYQDRVLYAMQYFHGTTDCAKLHLRSMALIWNFHPYGTKTRSKNPDRFCPFQDVNGFHYHDNWLQNMLVAASMGGWKT